MRVPLDLMPSRVNAEDLCAVERLGRGTIVVKQSRLLSSFFYPPVARVVFGVGSLEFRNRFR